jgi:hypothetical protein
MKLVGVMTTAKLLQIRSGLEFKHRPVHQFAHTTLGVGNPVFLLDLLGKQAADHGVESRVPACSQGASLGHNVVLDRQRQVLHSILHRITRKR